MGFVDILRKLGILRWGTVKATYKNAKERPLYFQDDYTINEKKDLTTKKDIKKLKKWLKGKK